VRGLLLKKQLWHHYYISRSVEGEPILLLRAGAVNMYKNTSEYVREYKLLRPDSTKCEVSGKFQFHKFCILFEYVKDFSTSDLYVFFTVHLIPNPVIFRILGRRFAFTLMAYKYQDIGISMGPVSAVKMFLGDNKDNQIILPHATWETFIARRANIENLMQSIALLSLSIRDLIT